MLPMKSSCEQLGREGKGKGGMGRRWRAPSFDTFRRRQQIKQTDRVAYSCNISIFGYRNKIMVRPSNAAFDAGRIGL